MNIKMNFINQTKPMLNQYQCHKTEYTIAKKQHDFKGFLHRHPKLEKEANLLEDHVIVDKSEWEAARMYHGS